MYHERPLIRRMMLYNDVEGLISTLRKGNRCFREAAAQALGKIKDLQALEPLMKALINDDKHVGRAAAIALGELGDLRAVDILIQALKNEEGSVRCAAAWALGKIADLRALEPLIKALNDDEKAVRCTAVRVLGGFTDPRVFALIKEALYDDDKDIRCAAARALGRGSVSKSKSAALLIESLKDGHWQVRETAAGELENLGWKPDRGENGAWYWIAKNKFINAGDLGLPAVGPFITVLLRDEFGQYRFNAAVILAGIGDKRAVKPLISALNDEIDDVCNAALCALGEIGDPKAVEPIIGVLNHKDFVARLSAVDVLAKFGDSRAIAPLTSTLKDNYPKVRTAAALALQQLGWEPDRGESGIWYWIVRGDWEKVINLGALAVPPLITFLALEESRKILCEKFYMDEDEREAGLRALGEIGDPRAVDVLIAHLNDTEPDIFGAAKAALVKIGPPAFSPLIEALKNCSAVVRKAAAEILENLNWKPPREEDQTWYLLAREDWEKAAASGSLVVESLIYNLEDENYYVKVSAARLLAEIGNLRAADPFLEILKDGNLELRQIAAKLLGEIGDPRAVEPLINYLKERDWYFNKTVAASLGKIGDSRAVEPLIEIIKDREEEIEIIQIAARALGEIGDLQAVDPLLEILKKGPGEVRHTAALVLEQLGWKPERGEELALYWMAKGKWDKVGEFGAAAAGPLAAALKDRSYDVRKSAAETLGNMGDPGSVTMLIDALRNEVHDEVIKAAAGALVNIGKTSEEAVIKLIKDGNRELYEAAAFILGEIGDLGTVKSLIALLDHENRYVYMAAEEALIEIGSTAVAPLTAVLKDERDAVRYKAATILYKIGDPRAVEPLIAALKDENVIVRYYAATAMGDFGVVRAVIPLTEVLRGGLQNVNAAAAQALKKLGWKPDLGETGAWYWINMSEWKKLKEMGPIAVEPLVTALETGNESIRAYAAEVLGDIGDLRAVKPLIVALEEDREVIVCCDAARALGKIGDLRALEPLAEALKDIDSKVRRAAAEGLMQIGQPALDALLAALRYKDDRVRGNAARALKEMGWKPDSGENGAWYWIAREKWNKVSSLGYRAVEPLIAVLDEMSVKENAAGALEKIRDPRAVDLMVASLEKENSEVCMKIVFALGSIGDPRVVELLIALLDDKYSGISNAAAWALGDIGDSRAVEPLIEILKDNSRGFHENYIHALGSIGDSRAVEVLIAAMEDSCSNVRKTAVIGLGKIGDARAVDPIISIFKEVNWDIRRASHQVNDYLSIERCFFQQDKDLDLRIAAARSLGQIGDPRAIDILVTCLKVDYDNIRQAAISALGEIGDSAVDPLIACLEDDDDSISSAAAETLVKLYGEAALDESSENKIMAEYNTIKKLIGIPLGKQF